MKQGVSCRRLKEKIHLMNKTVLKLGIDLAKEGFSGLPQAEEDLRNHLG